MQRKHTDEYREDPQTGCWIWQKNIRFGYGRAWRDGRLVTAHCWYWEQVHGPIPQGMDLDHTCHNTDLSCPGGHDCRHRRCVNPDHLVLAPRAENVRRGRIAKLTREQVAEIRAQPWVRAKDLAVRYGVSDRDTALTEAEVAQIKAAPRYYGSGRELAHKFGVPDSVISAIRTGQNWASVLPKGGDAKEVI